MILYVLFFGLWLIVAFRKQGLTPFTLLLIEYLFGSIMGLVLFYNYNTVEQIGEICYEGVIYHIAVLFLCFSPLQRFFNINIRSFNKIDEKALLFFSYFLISINIPALLYSASSLNDILTQYAFNLGAVRGDLYDDNLVLTEGFAWERLAAATSVFALIPFFELLSFKRHNLLKALLLLSSLELVIDNLRAMSRDGLFIWLLAIISLYLIFKDSFSPEIKKKFRIVYLLVIGVLVFFIAITISRAVGMAGADYSDPLYFFTSYAGQSFIGFQKVFRIEAMGVPGYYAPNSFYSFVKFFLVLIGPVWTVIVAALFNLTIRLFFRRKTFFELFVYLFLYIYFSFGMLYSYYFYELSGTLGSMLIILAMSFLVSKTRNSPNMYNIHNNSI